MVTHLELGKKYRVVENTCSHRFKIGQIVICTEHRPGFEQCISIGTKTAWYVNLEDLAEIEDVVVKQIDAPSIRSRIYAVVSEGDDENFLAITSLRDYARLVKSDLGGKAAGYKIIQFVAEKEVR